jgi:hypothetical protein
LAHEVLAVDMPPVYCARLEPIIELAVVEVHLNHASTGLACADLSLHGQAKVLRKEVYHLTEFVLNKTIITSWREYVYNELCKNYFVVKICIKKVGAKKPKTTKNLNDAVEFIAYLGAVFAHGEHVVSKYVNGEIVEIEAVTTQRRRKLVP